MPKAAVNGKPKRARKARRPKASTTTLSSPAQWLVDWVRNGADESGVVVNGKTALQYPPVWYAINKICGHVGSMPLVLYQRDGELSVQPARTHPAYRLMKRRPNSAMTPSVFKETIQQHSLLRGNGRSAILRNNRSDPAELIPLLPDRTITVLVNGDKWHVTQVHPPESQQFVGADPFETIKIPDEDVLHIPGLGYDGLSGYDVVEYARQSWGAGMAGDRDLNRHFKNKAVPELILEAPPGAFRSEDEAKTFLQNWNKYHNNLTGESRTALLRAGIKANVIGANAQQSQVQEQRLFQRQDAALWFLLEQILGDDSSVSYNSLEQKNQAYLTNCLMRWLVKWEEECNEKLLTEQQKRTDSHYFKFTTAALLRGTTKERFEVYNIARQAEIMNANECRLREEMNPYDGGDVYKNPAINPQQPSAKPKPTTEEPEPDEEQTKRAQDIIRGLIKARLLPLVHAECRVVVEAARREDNFVAWLDRYYGGESYVPNLTKAIQECGGTDADAAAYAGESKMILLDTAGRSERETLAGRIAIETEKWGGRVERFAVVLAKRKLT